MKIVFRWFGEKFDSVNLWKIRQIPGITGVVGTLMDVPAGELWPMEKIQNLYDVVKAENLEMEVIESVNIHEDIKLGQGKRDIYIENYKETIKNLSKIGVKVICYNFMPVFDWLRSNLNFKLDDKSEVLSYNNNFFEDVTMEELVKNIQNDSQGFELPGWEMDRLSELKITLDKYKNIDQDKLFENLKYFLERIIPTCEKYDIKMAIHPDDPPWNIFGLPRIVTNKENLQRLVNLVDSKYNGLTLCTGSLGVNLDNKLTDIIREFGKQERIHFVHVRNVKILSNKIFHESSHLSSDGSFDIYEIMKSLYDIRYNGYIRPDHGRMIWGEKSRPGYGLYDRALGIAYINGIWEAIKKNNME